MARPHRVLISMSLSHCGIIREAEDFEGTQIHSRSAQSHSVSGKFYISVNTSPAERSYNFVLELQETLKLEKYNYWNNIIYFQNKILKNRYTVYIQVMTQVECQFCQVCQHSKHEDASVHMCLFRPGCLCDCGSTVSAKCRVCIVILSSELLTSFLGKFPA